MTLDVSQAADFVFDPFDYATQEDPYPSYAWLRENAPLYELAFVSEDGAPVTASSGIRLACEPFGDAPGDTLVVGGATVPAPSSPGMIDFVRGARRRR